MPHAYLLDTNIFVHYARDDALKQRIEAEHHLLTGDTPLTISAVTVGELESLSRQWNWGEANIQQMRFYLTKVTLVSVSPDVPNLLRAYGIIDAASKTTGFTMGKNDLWIAATAHVTGATLLTTDRDFDHLDPDLLTREWIAP